MTGQTRKTQTKPCQACIQNHQILVMEISYLRDQVDTLRRELLEARSVAVHHHHIQEAVLAHIGLELDKRHLH
jgi:hypothetical protein